MEKLFAALRSLHEGYEVVDVRFLPAPAVEDGFDVSELDNLLAHAVKVADDINVRALV
ncbi:hypothetical protein GLF_0884 [Gluconobacter frateurii NBRC 101659]|nr:hypothetical protein GLF_0884 [Gluconobacter frateurii NBRC 101659]